MGFLRYLFLVVFILCLSSAHVLAKANPKMQTRKESAPKGNAYDQYLKFFEEVYQKMQENYYQPISREVYDKFVEDFKTKIYGQLKETKKSDDFVRWRSASLLVKRLKASDDIFSEIYPPKPAQEYKQTALGTRHDLGVEGALTDQGFKVSRLEPRADPYVQGLRENDIILKIDDQDVVKETQEKIQEQLNPLENTQVKIKFHSVRENVEKDVVAVSKEYFKQEVFMKPVPYPGVLYLQLERFNQKTAEDLFRFLDYFRKSTKMVGLILDLRGNPGGPPLAARELSAFFLSGGDDFAYFQKKDQPKQMLDVPKLPPPYHYDGPMVILLNEKSGSSSELFSGVMQKRKRAVVMGRNSAGQVFLKSMFNFDDGSMLLLVTGRGHHPDGSVFSFQGITPDKYFKEEEDEKIISFAATYIYYLNKQEQHAGST